MKLIDCLESLFIGAEHGLDAFGHPLFSATKYNNTLYLLPTCCPSTDLKPWQKLSTLRCVGRHRNTSYLVPRLGIVLFVLVDFSDLVMQSSVVDNISSRVGCSTILAATKAHGTAGESLRSSLFQVELTRVPCVPVPGKPLLRPSQQQPSLGIWNGDFHQPEEAPSLPQMWVANARPQTQERDVRVPGRNVYFHGNYSKHTQESFHHPSFASSLAWWVSPRLPAAIPWFLACA